MYEKFRNDVLRQIGDLPIEVLQRISTAFDVSVREYSIVESKTQPSILNCDKFLQKSEAYCISKRTEGLSPKTINHIDRVLRNFINSMIKPISEIKAGDIRAYLYNYQKERGSATEVWILLEQLFVLFSSGQRWKAIFYLTHPRM